MLKKIKPHARKSTTMTRIVMTPKKGENGGETRPKERQGDVEDVGHGDWVIVGGSDVLICMNSTRAEVTMSSIHGATGRGIVEMDVQCIIRIVNGVYAVLMMSPVVFTVSHLPRFGHASTPSVTFNLVTCSFDPK